MLGYDVHQKRPCLMAASDVQASWHCYHLYFLVSLLSSRIRAQETYNSRTAPESLGPRVSKQFSDCCIVLGCAGTWIQVLAFSVQWLLSSNHTASLIIFVNETFSFIAICQSKWYMLNLGKLDFSEGRCICMCVCVCFIFLIT